MKPTNVGGVLTPVCPYCGVEGKLHMRAYGLRWECPVAGCDARVGCHRDSLRGAPLGTMARQARRDARMAVHERFDPLWKSKPPRFPTRKAAYTWLAGVLGIEVARCHVAEFDEARCFLALAAIDSLQEVPHV